MLANEPVAVIDVGSNSIKLLVAKPGLAVGSIETIFAETIETRISAGISKTLPSLTRNAMDAGCNTITELVHLTQVYHPKAIQIVATSALRDATNAIQFIDLVREATGLEIKILTGTEEATYISKGIGCDPQISGVNSFIQMDIGGGSLELTRVRHGKIERALSLQLGAVRLTEQFIADRDTAISNATEALIRNHICAELKISGFNFEPKSDPLIVTGGAFTITRAILANELDMAIEEYSPILYIKEISRLKSKLMSLTLHERMAVPHLPAARADIAPVAFITMDAILDYAKRDNATHSFYNLRYGIAAELLTSESDIHHNQIKIDKD